jgi:DNA-binding transcriptional MocR family regulator
MAEDVRDCVAGALARTRTALVVDETLVELGLDAGAESPVPFAVHDAGTPIITVGSASKVFWGGLRIGWIRADPGTVLRLAALRSRQDLSSSVVEQLACARLLEDLAAVRAHRVGELRGQRDALGALLAARLPSWRFAVPPGGQVLWCELSAPVSGALAVAAGERGLRITPGSRFAADGTLESWLRLPYTRPVEELDRAIHLLASAWAHVTGERVVPASASSDRPALSTLSTLPAQGGAAVPAAAEAAFVV